MKEGRGASAVAAVLLATLLVATHSLATPASSSSSSLSVLSFTPIPVGIGNCTHLANCSDHGYCFEAANNESTFARGQASLVETTLIFYRFRKLPFRLLFLSFPRLENRCHGRSVPLSMFSGMDFGQLLPH